MCTVYTQRISIYLSIYIIDFRIVVIKQELVTYVVPFPLKILCTTTTHPYILGNLAQIYPKRRTQIYIVDISSNCANSVYVYYYIICVLIILQKRTSINLPQHQQIHIYKINNIDYTYIMLQIFRMLCCCLENLYKTRCFKKKKFILR